MMIAGLKIDPLAIAALGFLVLVILITVALFAWVMAQGRKQRGQI